MKTKYTIVENKLFLVLCFLLALYLFYCVRVKKSFPFQMGDKERNYQLYFYLPNSRSATDWYDVPKELYEAVDINGCIAVIDRRIVSDKQKFKKESLRNIIDAQ